MRKSALVTITVVAAGFLLSIDRLPLPIKAQVIPPLSFVCALLLPFFLLRIRKTPLLVAVAVFLGFVVIHSAIAAYIDFVIAGQPDIRLYAWLRQVVALFAGVSVFFVMRVFLARVSDRQLTMGILIGAVPALAVALANLAWGVTGNSLCGSVVTAARSTLLGSSHGMRAIPYRAAGLSSEPASFSQFLILILIPFIVTLIISARKRLRIYMLMLAVMAALFWTFSTTGFVLLFAVAILGIVFGPCRRLNFAFALLVIAAMAVILTRMRDTYMVAVLTEIWETGTSGTFMSKQYSTIGPLLTSFDSYAILGYGLGGSSAHFFQIMPEVAQQSILSVSWEGMPTLKTLAGRIFAETGLIGTVLIILIFVFALRQIRRTSGPKPQYRSALLASSRLALMAVVVSLATGGSFASSFLWFWLAVIDSRYVRTATSRFPAASYPNSSPARRCAETVRPIAPLVTNG